jgi:hypothetical protein
MTNILGKLSLFLKNNQLVVSVKNNIPYLSPHNNMMAVAVNSLFPANTGKRNNPKVSVKNPDTANSIIIDVANNRAFMAGIIIFLSIAYFYFSVLVRVHGDAPLYSISHSVRGAL